MYTYKQKEEPKASLLFIFCALGFSLDFVFLCLYEVFY